MFHRSTYSALLAIALVCWMTANTVAIEFARPEYRLNGQPAPPASLSHVGFSLLAAGSGPQVAILQEPGSLVVCVKPGEEVQCTVAAGKGQPKSTVTAEVRLMDGLQAEVSLAVGDTDVYRLLEGSQPLRLEVTVRQNDVLHLKTRGKTGETAVRWTNLRASGGNQTVELPVSAAPCELGAGPPPVLPAMRPAIQEALVEWDWRMQDGIGTPREPSSYAAAIERTLHRGEALVADLRSAGVALDEQAARWQQLGKEFQSLAGTAESDPRWEDLWRRVHTLRRAIALANPHLGTNPIALVKQVPSMFSHQLTQYYGSCARPGGGVFILEKPGQSMYCRPLTEELPPGSYQHLDVSYDGLRLLFAYVKADTTPVDREKHLDRTYHLYEVAADGSHRKQLTDGPYDDFAPRYLPDGKIIFVSTRRGGYHRCGRGPCAVYTLALAESDGSNPRTISFHETQEWDPSVLSDGRVIYTRWDYVDRSAVFYQQLWSVRPDGSDVRIFYGNNTLNPVGIWEAKAVPGSQRIMATAAAHHAMTAGSIILIDPTQGVDGPGPITRLTPDALFPESEAPLYLDPKRNWHAPIGVQQPPATLVEAKRWPGHCYRAAYPFSETYFLAAYSFDRLIGEPTWNPPNMFGLYLVDRFGNKELLYRDLNVSTIWAMPLVARAKPAVLPSLVQAGQKAEGAFFLRNVYESWPPLPAGSIKRLRIVQVLPKSTPHANTPPVGAANASPGKQVLGTVPVEEDGSAYFRAPAGVALAFQALDEAGQAVQIMRSITYLQPGETSSCVGCHEHRMTAPAQKRTPLAMSRDPSSITPGPDGSNPLSYPILVQPVLDKACVRCHSRQKAEGKVILSGEPEGRYTVSYNALVSRVRYSAWGGVLENGEPATMPGRFGAVNSPLMQLLRKGHEGVTLGAEDLDRLITWIDANALFYGTFNPADQARQQRGERIAGPDIQ